MMTETSGRRSFAFIAALMAGVLMTLSAGQTNAEDGARIKAGNQLIVEPGSRLKIAPGGKTARIYTAGSEESKRYSCRCTVGSKANDDCYLEPKADGQGALCKGAGKCDDCLLTVGILIKQKFGSRRLEQWPFRMRASTMGSRSRWMAKVDEPTACSSSGYGDR